MMGHSIFRSDVDSRGRDSSPADVAAPFRNLLWRPCGDNSSSYTLGGRGGTGKLPDLAIDGSAAAVTSSLRGREIAPTDRLPKLLIEGNADKTARSTVLASERSYAREGFYEHSAAHDRTRVADGRDRVRSAPARADGLAVHGEAVLPASAPMLRPGARTAESADRALKVTFDATRATEGMHSIKDVTLTHAHGSLRLARTGATWKVEGKERLSATDSRLLNSLGVKLKPDGTFEGTFEITKEKHSLKYQDADGPQRHVTYLGKAGLRSFDFETYTRKITDQHGRKSTTAWDGHDWRPIVGEPQITKRNGVTTASMELRTHANNPRATTTLIRTSDPEHLDRARLVSHGPTGQVTSDATYNWPNKSRTVHSEHGKAAGNVEQYHDGHSGYRAGKLVSQHPDSGFPGVSFNAKDGSGSPITRRSDIVGGYHMFEGPTFKFFKNGADVVTSVGFEKTGAVSKLVTLDRDKNQDVNRITLPDGKSRITFTRVGTEVAPGLSVELSRGTKNLHNVPTNKFNQWQVEKDGQVVGHCKMNFGVDRSANMTFTYPKSKPVWDSSWSHERTTLSPKDKFTLPGIELIKPKLPPPPVPRRGDRLV